MTELGQERRRAFRVIAGEGRGERRALERVLGRRHLWLWKFMAGFLVLCAVAFMLAPAFGRRAPHVTPEEVAAALEASEGLGPLVAGLAEVMELDARQAAALEGTLARFDARATPLRLQREAALQVLRGAASGEGAEGEVVEVALGQLREAQERLHALDRDLLEAVTPGLTPSQRARAALVLGHHLQRGGQAPPAPQATTAPATHP